MANNKATETALAIVEVLGGEKNIKSYTNCMTRLRVKVKDKSIIDDNLIKKTKNVMGLVKNGDELQIILGPGFVRQVREVIQKQFPNINAQTEVDEILVKDGSPSLTEISAKNKEEQKMKNTSSLQIFLAKFAKIFTPLIPAFIGAGILAGIAGLMQGFCQEIDPNDPSITYWTNEVAYSWYQVFNMMLSIWKDAFIIIVGWRTAEVFGGEGVFGALASLMFVGAFAGLYTAPFISEGADGFMFLGIHIQDPMTNWLTIGFRPSEIVDENGVVTGYTLAGSTGGVIGAMIMAALTIPVVNWIRKFTPGVLDLLIASTLATLSFVFLSYFLIIPISGMIFVFISYLFDHLASNPFGAAVLAGLFLIAVVFGVHQGFIPVYVALLDSTGVNSLFAILTMGGAGQVGAAIAIYFKAEKDASIRNQIRGAIIPGFLGIGEPLIYGISITRPKVFLSASLGAAVAGFFIGAMSSWFGITIGLNTVFGPGGLSAIPLMVASIDGVVGYNLMAMGIYVIALIIAYLSAFGFVYLIGTKGVDLS